ncbi:MAG: amidohydrolase family protein [Clostridia bacterium]|nr:amidohydrolase family protein [Clostridia bacterium]
MQYKNVQEFASQFEITDAHAHIFPEKIARKAVSAIGKFYDIEMFDGDGISEALLKSGSPIGVKKYLVCSAATTPMQVESINHFIVEECKKHSEFFGFGTMHPDFEDIEGQIQFCIDNGLHGIKLHPDFQQFDIDAEKAYKIYALCEGKLAVLFHTGDNRYDFSSPVRLSKVAKDFPNLICLASHFGGYRRWEDASEYLAGLPNVYYDTSSALPFISAERAKELIDIYGLEKMFFGVDFPMWNHTEELERFMALDLTPEQNKAILSDNFKKVFNL